MNPLLVTTFFLMLMSIFTASEIKTFVDEHKGETLHTSTLTAEQKQQALREEARYDDARAHVTIDPKLTQKKDPSEKKSAGNDHPLPLHVNRHRPPNTARLNLWVILQKDPSHDLQNTLCRLLHNLYSEEITLPNFEERFLEALRNRWDELSKIEKPEEIAAIDFEDKELQQLIYTLFQGGKKAPSLLNFITFDRSVNKLQKKINFMYAPPEILSALIQNDDALHELLKVRQHHWARIDKQEEDRLNLRKADGFNRTQLKTDLTDDVRAIAKAHRLIKCHTIDHLDYSLQNPGNVIVIHDPQTHTYFRERIQ